MGKVARARIDKRGDLFRRQHWLAVGQNNMAAYAERRRSEGKLDSFIRGAGASHERGAGYKANAVQFDDGAIDAGGQPEIVGVHDELAHSVSLSS